MSNTMTHKDQAKLAFVIPVIFVLVILLSAFVLYLLFRRHRRAGRIDVPAVIPRRLHVPRPGLELAEESQSFNKEERKKRRQVVLQSIVCKKVLVDSIHCNSDRTNVHTDEEQGKCDETYNLDESNQAHIQISRSYSTSACPICCENYRVDDSIGLSKNLKCNHFFHVECLVHWLMKHDDCPLCRAKYFSKSESQIVKRQNQLIH